MGLATTIDEAEPVTITLPAVAMTVPAGHRLKVGLASTDQVFSTPNEEQVYEVALAEAELSIPQVSGAASSDTSGRAATVRLIVIVGAAILVVAGIIAFVLMRRPSRSRLRRG